MISFNVVSVALCFMMFPFVESISFLSLGIGAGISSPQQGVFGTSTVLGNGNFASTSTAASGDTVSGSTSVISPVEVTESDVLSPPAGSPEAESNIDISSLLGRGLQADVPDYRDASVSPGNTYTTGKSGNHETKSTKNVSEEKSGNVHRPKVCWTMSKQCCYEEVQKGYECKDFYEYKYARCHPVIDYEEVCGEIRERPVHHPRPKGRVKYEETVLKNYDARYGPHVAGYKERGESEYYRTDYIPTKPRGVSGTPFPAPQSYQSGNGGKTNGEDDARGTYGNTLSVAPYETKNNAQTSGAGRPQSAEKKGTKPIQKTTKSGTTGAGGTYKMSGEPEQRHGKTSKSNSESKTGATGTVTQDQTKAGYDTPATLASPSQGNMPSYRIARQT